MAVHSIAPADSISLVLCQPHDRSISAKPAEFGFVRLPARLLAQAPWNDIPTQACYDCERAAQFLPDTLQMGRLMFGVAPQIRYALLVLGAICVGTDAAAVPKSLRFMHGVWQGDGHMVLLDMERLFGRVDDVAKPFQRDALIIRNITEQMVVFTVGARQFIGLFEGDTLALSGDGLAGTVRLERPPR